MARGVNKVILIGHLGADPEMRNTAGGMQVANLRIATTENWNDRQSGQKQERTEWHRVVLFGALAGIAQQYLRKGRQVYIEGRLQTRKWQDKQSGQDRYSTEIVATDMTMLGGGGDAGMSGSRGGDFAPPPDDYGSAGGYGASSGSGNYGSASSASGSYASASGGSASAGSGGGSSEPRQDFDDEIPF